MQGNTQISDEMMRVALDAYNEAISNLERSNEPMSLDDIRQIGIKAALSAALAGHVVGWRTMDSAPNNGTKHAWPYVTVLVVDEDGDVTQADYKGKEDGWWPANTDSEYGSRIYPTHWQPLPAPPAQREG